MTTDWSGPLTGPHATRSGFPHRSTDGGTPQFPDSPRRSTMNTPRNVLIAVAFLGAAVLLTLAGAIWLASQDKELPQAVVAIGSACGGALVTYVGVRPTS